MIAYVKWSKRWFQITRWNTLFSRFTFSNNFPSIKSRQQKRNLTYHGRYTWYVQTYLIEQYFNGLTNSKRSMSRWKYSIIVTCYVMILFVSLHHMLEKFHPEPKNLKKTLLDNSHWKIKAMWFCIGWECYQEKMIAQSKHLPTDRSIECLK